MRKSQTSTVKVDDRCRPCTGLVSRQASRNAEELQVGADFPNASGEVESIDQQARIIKIHPTPHPGRGWDCWWYFSVSGIQPGETITIDLAGDRFAQADHAVFSTDGHAWQHTSAGEKQGARIIYKQKIDADQAWFAWGPPLGNDEAAAIVKSAAAKCAEAEAFELCRSRENRPVWALRLSPPMDGDSGTLGTNFPPNRRHGVFVTARQHAWECGGSWVCRGLIEWLTSDDPRAAEIRRSTTFEIVPVMDVDNVARGAGGKEENPQDHNRDWTDHPYHPAVAAAQREIMRMNAANEFDLFIDLHNPGPTEKASVFFVSPRSIVSSQGQANLEHFLAAAQNEMTGPIPLREEPRESGPSYDARWRQIGKNWVTGHAADRVVSVTLETAWNTPQSTSEGYLTTGRQLGMAIARYFREPAKRTAAE